MEAVVVVVVVRIPVARFEAVLCVLERAPRVLVLVAAEVVVLQQAEPRLGVVEQTLCPRPPQ